MSEIFILAELSLYQSNRLYSSLHLTVRQLDLLLSLFVASIPFPPPVLQIREIQTSNERLCDYELHQRPARRANLTRQVGEGRSASGKKVKERRRGESERKRQKERKKKEKRGRARQCY